MYLKVTVILMTAVVFLSSCATIVSRTTFPVSINSTPNAQISITDKYGKQIYLGNTPTVVPLKSGAGFFTKAEYQVKFSSPGYNDKIVPILFQLNGWYFGNILFGGLIGLIIVDPATGAMWTIETQFLNETLTPTAAASITPEMKILDISQIPESWKSHLVQIN